MKTKIYTQLKNSKLVRQLVRYLAMGSIVVIVEIGTFWLINSVLNINYLVATAASMLVGIILNWLGSKYLVFKESRFTPVKEFILVFVVSLVGLVIQITTIYIMVDKLHLVPLVGKIAAIGVTFIWNFFIRRVYIFRVGPKDGSQTS